jgi:ribosome-associated protein
VGHDAEGRLTVEPVDGVVVTPAGRHIAAVAVSWHATRSGGPGGQHANTSETAVTVVVDVDSTGLPASVRRRIIEAAGPTVSATSSRSRSQWRNRVQAWQQALERIDELAAPPPPRVPTRPSRAAKEERLAGKRRVAERKASRRAPSTDD